MCYSTNLLSYVWGNFQNKEFYHLNLRMKIFKAAAVAKSIQSCPTRCDPIDGSPPGSPVPGILQARTLEWVAISFSLVRVYSGQPKPRFPGGSAGKESACNSRIFLGWEDPLEKGMATHSGILVWRIPGNVYNLWCRRAGNHWATFTLIQAEEIFPLKSKK